MVSVIIRLSLITGHLPINHRLRYQKLNTRKEECVRRIDIVNIAALVGLAMLLFFVGGGIAVWLLFTSKLPQPDYRMNTRKSLIFVAVCGVLFLLVYLLGQVLHPLFDIG
ncbi:MAG: hypothetical protein ACQ9MH_16225 [Nitrospinales bacterium]